MDLVRSALYNSVINERTTDDTTVDSFIAEALPRIERALVARYGLEHGTEATAEAAAYAVEHWPQLVAMGNPVGYLYRVGSSNALRALKVSDRTGLLVAEPRTTDQVFDIDLQRALLKLKPEERVAIMLTHAHGHSYAEAAELLDVPTTTIANNLSRGLNRLRTILEP